MKRVLVVMEALAHDYLQEQQPPNIVKHFDDIHPAVTWGLGSRPSAGAYMGGMLPICQIPQCHHRDIQRNWAEPWFMTRMQELGELFLMSSNGWTTELLMPWMTQEQRRMNLDWIEMRSDQLPAKDMVTYFLDASAEVENFFAYIHMFETHYPFHAPDLPRNGQHRDEALRYVDEQVGRLMEGVDEDVEVVLCSDHNLPPQIVSAANDVPAPKTMLSFIATNFETCESTLGGRNRIQYARDMYLDDE